MSYVLRVLEHFAMPSPAGDITTLPKILSSDTEEDRKAWRNKIKARIGNRANKAFIRRDDRVDSWIPETLSVLQRRTTKITAAVPGGVANSSNVPKWSNGAKKLSHPIRRAIKRSLGSEPDGN